MQAGWTQERGFSASKTWLPSGYAFCYKWVLYGEWPKDQSTRSAHQTWEGFGTLRSPVRPNSQLHPVSRASVFYKTSFKSKMDFPVAFACCRIATSFRCAKILTLRVAYIRKTRSDGACNYLPMTHQWLLLCGFRFAGPDYGRTPDGKIVETGPELCE